TVFFFSSRRRHTRLQGDWSSDVCSSDLPPGKTGRCRRRRGYLYHADGRKRRSAPQVHRGKRPRSREPRHLVCNAGLSWTGFQLRSEEHTSELQSPCNLVCRLLLEKKKK